MPPHRAPIAWCSHGLQLLGARRQMCTCDRAEHHWLSAPNTQPRRAVSNFYLDDARRSDGTAMPSRAGDSQCPPTPPNTLFLDFWFFPLYFLFLRRSHYDYDAEPIFTSEARFGFRCSFKSRFNHNRRNPVLLIRPRQSSYREGVEAVPRLRSNGLALLPVILRNSATHAISVAVLRPTTTIARSL